MPGTAKVDPACAICRAPASQKCGCEANALEVATAQAEERYIRPLYADVRSWVRARARDYILAYFHIISEPVKNAYSANLNQLTADTYHNHNHHHRNHHHHHHHHHRQPHQPHPNPAALAAIDRDYRHNIDRAWRHAVKRYPEILNYFYSLVHVTLPEDLDPAVRGPALDRLADLRHRPRRRTAAAAAAPVASAPHFPMPPFAASSPLQPPMAVPCPGPPPQPQPQPQFHPPPPHPSLYTIHPGAPIWTFPL